MNGGNATSETIESPKFRLRVARACESCKSSHLSCGKERPCPRCVKNGVGHLCVDSTPKQRQKRKGSDEKEKSYEIKENNREGANSSKRFVRSPISSSSIELSNSAKKTGAESLLKEEEKAKVEEVFEFGTSPLLDNVDLPSNTANEPVQTPSGTPIEPALGQVNELYESDFSPMSLKDIEQMFLQASSQMNDSMQNIDAIIFDDALTEKVVKFFVRSQWMGEREARNSIQAIQGNIYQKATLLRSLTPEQREQIETEKALKFQMTKENVSQNPMPTVIFNDTYELVFANDAFIQLTGLPDNVMNTLLGGLQCFQFHPETIRAAIWGYITPVNGPEVYPSFVRMWTNKNNYKTVKIGEHDFLEGTSWAMRYTGPFDSVIFSTRQFLPAPSTIPI